MACVLCVGVTACSSANPDERSITYESTLPPGCEEQYRAFIMQVHEAKACTTSSECAFAGFGNLPIYEHCGFGFYANPSHPLLTTDAGGQSPLGQASNAVAACFETVLPGCFGPPPAPECWRGKCWPVDDVSNAVGAHDACFAASGKDACAECLCGVLPFGTRVCLQDPGCAGLMACARKRGHLGHYQEQSTAGLPYPTDACGDDFQQATPEVQAAFTGVAFAASRSGCFAFCGN